MAAHNRTLGREKQQTRRKGVAKTEAKLDADMMQMPWLLIVNVLRQLAEGHKQLTEPKRGNLKMCGDRFGDLTIDHTLVAGQVKAFKDI